MNDYDVKNDIRELFQRVDGIKNTQIHIQSEILDLSKRLTDNLQRDFDNNKELHDKIKTMASSAGRGAGIKWGAIITAIGGAIAAILSAL